MQEAGCFIIFMYSLMIFVVSWVGSLLMGYNLDIWLGYELWFEVNFILRLIIGLISISVLIPLTVIGFVLALVFGTPLLV